MAPLKLFHINLNFNSNKIHKKKSQKIKYWDFRTPSFQMKHFIDLITGTKTQNALEKISKTNMIYTPRKVPDTLESKF